MGKKGIEKNELNELLRLRVWEDILELKKSEIGKRELDKHEALVNELERLIVITSTGNISKIDKADLTEQLEPVIEKVGEVEGKVITLEDGSLRNIRAIFVEVLKHIQGRVDKKWEEDIINFLFGIKKKRGINHLRFSQMSGLSHSYICRLEKQDRNTLSLDAFKKLSNALGYSMPEVLNMYTDESSDEAGVPKFEDVVMTNSFELKGSLASSKKKKKIIELISSLEELDWEENMENISKLVQIMNKYTN